VVAARVPSSDSKIPGRVSILNGVITAGFDIVGTSCSFLIGDPKSIREAFSRLTAGLTLSSRRSAHITRSG
jgi:hypothetical protein